VGLDGDYEEQEAYDGALVLMAMKNSGKQYSADWDIASSPPVFDDYHTSVEESLKISTSFDRPSPNPRKHSSSPAAKFEPQSSSPISNSAQTPSMSRSSPIPKNEEEGVGDNPNQHKGDPDRMGWGDSMLFRTSISNDQNSDPAPRRHFRYVQIDTQHETPAVDFAQDIDTDDEMEDVQQSNGRQEVLPQQSQELGLAGPDDHIKSHKAFRIREGELLKIRPTAKSKKGSDHFSKVCLKYGEFKQLMNLRGTPHKIAEFTKIMTGDMKDPARWDPNIDPQLSK
jgi:hypothetical protein